MHTPAEAPQPDFALPTVASVAVVAYALANLAHEGLGHGGACALVGGHPRELTAVAFDCGSEALPPAAVRAVAAAGTVLNFTVALLAWLLLRRARETAVVWRLFLWLTLTVNLLQGTGYWLFSGIGGIGDWATVAQTLPRPGLVRVPLAVVGALGYWAVVWLALQGLSTFVGGGPDRIARARRICLTSYLAGGALYVAAGLLNPVSPLLVLISAAAASLGGTSALAWMSEVMGAPAFARAGAPAAVPRSTAWMVAAGIVTLVFVFVLGPGVRL